MKNVTSIRVEQEILNHLRNLNVNVSDYVNTLLIEDLTKKSFNDSKLKRVVTIAINEEKKKQIKEEMRVIGAVNNIAQRLHYMSKEDENVYLSLLNKNLDLLKLEYDNETYSKDTKLLIKDKFRVLNKMNKNILGEKAEIKKLKNDKEKN